MFAYGDPDVAEERRTGRVVAAVLALSGVTAAVIYGGVVFANNLNGSTRTATESSGPPAPTTTPPLETTPPATASEATTTAPSTSESQSAATTTEATTSSAPETTATAEPSPTVPLPSPPPSPTPPRTQAPSAGEAVVNTANSNDPNWVQGNGAIVRNNAYADGNLGEFMNGTQVTEVCDLAVNGVKIVVVRQSFDSNPSNYGKGYMLEALAPPAQTLPECPPGPPDNPAGD